MCPACCCALLFSCLLATCVQLLAWRMQDSGRAGQATAMHYSNAQWRHLGVRGLTPGAADNLALAISPAGVVHLAFQVGGAEEGPSVQCVVHGLRPDARQPESLHPPSSPPVAAGVCACRTSALLSPRGVS